jgi:hypothetical protein
LKCDPGIESVVRTFTKYEELLNRTYLLLLHLSNRCGKAASDVYEKDLCPVEMNKCNSDFMYEMSYVLKFVSESLEIQTDVNTIDIDKIKTGLGITT